MPVGRLLELCQKLLQRLIPRRWFEIKNDLFHAKAIKQHLHTAVLDPPST